MQINPIAHATSRDANTPAMALRETLTELERHIGKINHSTPDALKEIPVVFQTATDLIAELETAEANIDAEKVRFETLSRQFQRNKRDYIKHLGGMKSYITQISDESKPEEYWWWHLHDLITHEDQVRRKLLLRNLGIGMGIFIVLAVLYMLFLAPDEVTRKTVRLESEAEHAVLVGDYAAALPALDEAVQINPDETRLWIFRGVVHNLLGNDEQAEADFAYAREHTEDEVSFLVSRAQIYMTAGQPEMTLSDAESAIALNPESAFAYYQVGSAYNVMQQTLDALSAYETCAELAKEQGMTELEGMARVQMAYIYGGQ